MKGFNFKKITLIYVSLLVIIWLLAAGVDTFIFNNGKFLDLLIMDIPEMLLFHRILFILLGTFIFFAVLLYKLERKLKISEQKLKEANATKDKFFSIIAHDFKSPFSGFMSLSESLMLDYEQMDKKEIYEIGKSMYDTAKKLYDFLENLLIWARSQMYELKCIPVQINLNEVVSKICSIYGPIATKKGIQIHLDIDNKQNIRADKFMIECIFNNLVANAIKFSYPGNSVKISSKALSNRNVEISVSDNGVGMKPEAVQKLFHLETKFTKPGTANEQGSGLGLILCKEMIEKHGGTLKVESEYNVGSRFEFTLPAA